MSSGALVWLLYVQAFNDTKVFDVESVQSCWMTDSMRGDEAIGNAKAGSETILPQQRMGIGEIGCGGSGSRKSIEELLDSMEISFVLATHYEFHGDDAWNEEFFCCSTL